MTIHQSPILSTGSPSPSVWRVAVVAAVAAAVAAGCGGGADDGDGDGAAESAAATTSAAAADPTTTGATETTGASAETPTPAPAESGDGSLDPCSLMSSDEAAAVLGAQPEEPKPVEAGAIRSCFHILPDASASIQIQLERGDPAAFLAQLSQGQAETIDGVGDGAVVDEIQGVIVVVKGDVRFAIFVTLAGAAKADVATLTGLAQTAVSRL